MYYVFFDTFDLGLIKSIAGKYFKLVTAQLKQDCELVIQPGGCVDAERIKEYFDEGIGKMLNFLECFAYLGRICTCQPCCNEHMCVLASDQSKCINKELEREIKEFLNIFPRLDPRDENTRSNRLTFQRLSQKFTNAHKLNVEEIKIKDKHSNKSAAYLSLYIRMAKRYIKKNPAGFKYIMADRTNVANSHYTKFQTGINYTGLTPCSDIP